MGHSITFDVLNFVKKLRVLGVSQEKAELEAETIKEIAENLIALHEEMLNKENKDIKADIRELRTEISNLRADLKSDFKWLLGIFFLGFSALAGMIAHGLHWL